MATSTVERYDGGCGRSPVEPVQRCLVDMSAALADVVEVAAWTLTEEQLVDRIGAALEVRCGLDELLARLVSSALERDLARLAGATSATAWLMASHQLPRRHAAELIAHTSGVGAGMETTRRAWAGGDVNTGQAMLIAAAVNRLGADIEPSAVVKAQTHLIALAPHYSHHELGYLAAHLVEVVDPDGAEATLGARLHADEDNALHATVFRARRGADGIGSFAGKLPNAQLDMLTCALQAIAAPRRHTNTTGDGDGPSAGFGASDGDGDDVRVRAGVARGDGSSSVFDVDGDHTDPATGPLTYPQRMGQAFAELIEHLPVDKLPQHGVANASIVVTMTLNQLQTGLGEAILDTGGVMSVSQTRRLACNAALIPIVLDGDSTILDHGSGKRLYDRHQRLALAVRDQGCIFPHCNRPPTWCEAHHIKPWSQGGPTDLANGCLLCGFHHRLIHQGQWHVTMAADGTPETIPPTRIDPTQRPIRHTRLTTPTHRPLRT